MSRHADLRRVIWSAMVSVVKPGSRLANSTIFIMHLVDSSLNLSHRPKSSCTLWSALEFWEKERWTLLSVRVHTVFVLLAKQWAGGFSGV